MPKPAIANLAAVEKMNIWGGGSEKGERKTDENYINDEKVLKCIFLGYEI